MTVLSFEAPAVVRREHATRTRRTGHARRPPIFAKLRLWRRRAKERAELASLDDRMLADIGIGRAEAQFLSDKPFWRE
jgi:uncharacterized protein YjiS (DUF1127 family)